ncbi:hypothetical protein ACFU7Y_14710 [Kitasatospora sp. NPDC057542]|uniref:hypothetical protein n=1 Tax=Kitasatospora sp. NPDC057542 TaxID=3346162 RepID=UPI003695F2C8
MAGKIIGWWGCGGELVEQEARRGALLTSVLITGPEVAEDPYGSEPVVRWRDVRELDANPGAWPVAADSDRPRWDWTPAEGVGPLRFGMSPPQVAAVLDGESPAARRGLHAWAWQGVGPWSLEEDHFDRAGVTAHYWGREGIPTLSAVTVHGRTGPQVEFEGIRLTGRAVSDVDAALEQIAADRGTLLRFTPRGDGGVEGTNIWVGAVRAGDTVVSEATFYTPDWEGDF